MLYIYEASDKEGALVKGELESLSPEAVIEYLGKRGLIPISIQEKGLVKGIARLSSFVLFERVTAIDRILLVRNLGATIKAGLNIIEALDILIADATKKVMRNILTHAKTNLENGQPLSATFSAYKKYFPVIFTGMLKAGETAGNLDVTLEELSRYLIRDHNLNRRVRSALAYPIILLIGSLGVILLLLTFVLPRLAKTFQQSGAELPFITKSLVILSNVIAAYPLLDLLLIIALVWFFAYFRKTPWGRQFFIKIIFKIPIAKELVKKVALVRFTRTLGSLIGSGITIIEALHLSAESIGNELYSQAVLVSAERVKSGVPFYKTFQDYPELFPRFLTSLIEVGERTGTLENILKVFSDFYDEEVDNNLKDLTTLLEPILLLILGLIIGTIAVSIMLPIYQLVGKFT